MTPVVSSVAAARLGLTAVFSDQLARSVLFDPATQDASRAWRELALCEQAFDALVVAASPVFEKPRFAPAAMCEALSVVTEAIQPSVSLWDTPGADLVVTGRDLDVVEGLRVLRVVFALLSTGLSRKSLKRIGSTLVVEVSKLPSGDIRIGLRGDTDEFVDSARLSGRKSGAWRCIAETVVASGGQALLWRSARTLLHIVFCGTTHADRATHR